MDSSQLAQLLGRKREIRAQAMGDRHSQDDRKKLGRLICRRLAELPQFVAARTVMLYVDDGREVATRDFVEETLDPGKRVVVPYCIDGHIVLFRLNSLDELTKGAYGILEPKVELRRLGDRGVDVSELDLVVVPGVAFDSRGGRIGRGKGYYDKLLKSVRSDTLLVALAFESQLFEKIPMLPHDVAMHVVITEEHVYSDQDV